MDSYYKIKIHLAFFLTALSAFIPCSCCLNKAVQETIPISDLYAQQSKLKGYYTAQKGESLFFIAWRLSFDYRDLAEWNNLKKPYILHSGEKLRLSPLSTITKLNKRSDPSITFYDKSWQPPVHGILLRSYSERTKGIDIKAPVGTPVLASAAGEVVYSGTGIRGYGNLIILKHNEEYMTVYAHNKKNLVQTGQYVKSGQAIALLARTPEQSILHFEVRKKGKAIDPLKFIHPHRVRYPLT